MKVGSIYELNGWVKTININSSPFIELEFRNNENLIGIASTLKGNIMTGTKDWELIKVIFKVPAATSKVIIKAGLNSSTNAGGKVWFDDIKVNETH